jgi:hypothetical protein
MAGRAYSTEAVVLRTIRLGEADRVLHLYTEAHGRVGAVAKGVRKTMSRFGARLEPLSHVELVLHRGRGELETVTAAQFVRSHREAREDYYRFSVGMIGAEAMLRLFSEEESNERAFAALTRFLDLLDEAPHAADSPSLDPLGLAFQLKLLWLAGYLPHVSATPRGRAARSAPGALRRRRRSRSAVTGSPGSRRCSRGRSQMRRVSASPSVRCGTPCASSAPRTSTTVASGCGRWRAAAPDQPA